MVDPVLDAYSVGEHLFIISGPTAPVSIRDQMIRACMLADRLIENRIVDEVLPVLVVGAGAAGATVAMRLAEKESIKVTLIDIRDRPFGIQAESKRYIDPFQYDWPSRHWRERQFPDPSGCAVPLPWELNQGFELASRWQDLLENAPSSLEFLRNCQISSRQNRKDSVVVELLKDKIKLEARVYRLIIWAAGFGFEDCTLQSENTLAPTYNGPAFWSSDSYEACSCGFSDQPGQANVFISGSGDGALQDFLRILTKKKTARDILLAIKGDSPTLTKLFGEIADDLREVEDFISRHWIWNRKQRESESPNHDNKMFAFAHAEHEKLAEALLKTEEVRVNMEALLGPELDSVRLVFRNDYFKCFYPLNRFLVILVAKYLEGRGVHCLLSGCILYKCTEYDFSTVSPPPPICPNKKNQVYQVKIERLPSGPDLGQRWTDWSNLVIVRHGLLRDSVPLPEGIIDPPLRRPRHSLPHRLFR